MTILILPEIFEFLKIFKFCCTMQFQIDDLLSEKEITEMQLNQLASSLKQATKRFKEEKETSHTLNEKLQHLAQTNDEKQKMIESLHDDLEKAEQYILKLQRVLKTKELDISHVITERDNALNHIAHIDQKGFELHRKLIVMDEVRRSLHNKVMRYVILTIYFVA